MITLGRKYDLLNAPPFLPAGGLHVQHRRRVANGRAEIHVLRPLTNGRPSSHQSCVLTAVRPGVTLG